MKRELSAFTILETIVTMVIMGIVIGISYVFLSSIYHQYYLYERSTSTTENYANVIYQMNRAFFLCDEVIEFKGEIFFVEGNDTITVKDKIDYSKLNVSFISIDTLITSKQRVVECKFEFQSGQGSKEINFIKELF